MNVTPLVALHSRQGRGSVTTLSLSGSAKSVRGLTLELSGVPPQNAQVSIDISATLNTLTASAAYIGVFIFYNHIKYHLLNMLKIKNDINQRYLKTIDLHFVKSE